MKATEAKLFDLLKASPQFVIPIYRRTYSWTAPQCRQLWDDILRAGEGFHLAGYAIIEESGRCPADGAARRLHE